MKTVYQTPEVRIVEMQVQGILALSPLSTNDEQTVSGTYGGWVKENTATSRPDYNVWNDDWSK